MYINHPSSAVATGTSAATNVSSVDFDVGQGDYIQWTNRYM